MTAVSQLVKEMTSLCFIYDMGFSNLMRKHELGVGMNLSGKVYFMLSTNPTTYEEM